MKMMTKLKLRFRALWILALVWWKFTSKETLLSDDREDGNGSRNQRLCNPLNKLYRYEMAGKSVMKRSEIARYEFVSSLSETSKEGLEEGLIDTLQTLLLWTADLRGRKE